jgi:hypothetical protein
MNLKANALRERQLKRKMAPALARLLEYPFSALYWLRVTLRGAPFQRPFDYSLYTMAEPNRRVSHHVAHPNPLWKGR